jgi:GT2 family glycosyltransferase
MLGIKWRDLSKLAASLGFPGLAKTLAKKSRRVTGELLYQRWIDERQFRSDQWAKIELTLMPRFSIIMPTYNAPLFFLEKAIKSILAQSYQNWELCIVDDGSENKIEIENLVRTLSRENAAIKFSSLPENRGISAASNAALAVASGDFIALVDQDDEIAPHALHAFAAAINQNPNADWLYSDEDKIDEKGNRSGPFFKPDWSPAFFLSCMYTCHLGVYRRKLVDQLKGFRSEFDFAQDYDLALRFASITDKVVHVPDVLYHWRMLPQSTASSADAKPEAEHRARAAVQAFIDRGKYPGLALPALRPGLHRVKYAIQGNPLVSIAIPSAGQRQPSDAQSDWYVLNLVRSILDKSTYKNIEIVVAGNDDFDDELIATLKNMGVVYDSYRSAVFNLAEKMNFVVSLTSGEYVIILNDDISVISEDWIEEMLMWAQQEDIVGVGAKLLFPNEKIQHAGVLLLGQGPSHPYYLHDKSEVGLVGNAISAHEASAVTGACMMVRRSDYISCGGFDPAFRINYNDVDFCLRLRQQTGGRIIWTPHAQLYHFESVSVEPAPPDELSAINSRWAHLIGSDPYYNRNLSPVSNCYEISPRIRKLSDDYVFGRLPH